MTFEERQARIAELQIVRDEAHAEIVALLQEAAVMDTVTGTPAERAVSEVLDTRREARAQGRRAAIAARAGKDGSK